MLKLAFICTLAGYILITVANGKSEEKVKNSNYLKELQDKDTCCSTRIEDLHFRITNPSYPEPDSESKRYSYKTVIQQETCGLRVSYENIMLYMPDSTSANTCSRDSIVILVPDFPTQPQCGQLNNFQVNVPVKEGDEVEILVVVQSTRYSWNMVISQIPCAAIESEPLAKYKDHCGRRSRNNVGWLHDLDSGTNVNENEVPQTIVNDPDMNSYDATSDLFRCHLERVVDKVAAKTVPIDRIVNGQVARRSWPWQILLLVRGKQLLCGGALISPNLAITAGHCIAAVQKQIGLPNLVIASGIHRMGSPATGVQYRRCKYAVIHPQYAEVRQDIGLCYLDAPIQLSDRTGPVCLPFDKAHINQTFVGEKGIITGFGKTSANGGPSSTLREASIPLVSNQDCSEAWVETGGKTFSTLVDSTMICGGGNNRSTCNGDSGGPLSIHNPVTDRYTLIGLTSFGPSTICNVPGKPLSVFSRITSQLQFLSLATAEVIHDTDNLKTYLPLPC